MRRIAGGRIRVLEWGVLLLAVSLIARLVVIQVAGHKQYLAKAKNQWGHKEPIPSLRGNLYDRDGRPLALSATTWRVGIATSRVKDQGRVCRGAARVLGLDATQLEARVRKAGGRWIRLAPEAVLCQGGIDTLASLEAVTLERLSDRVYPLDGTAASLIGFYRLDKSRDGEQEFATGLELGLSEKLKGRPGSEWRIDTGLPGQSMGTQTIEAPEHGRHLLLTLDVDLQRICEEELARGIDECNARGGVVVVVEPHSGEVMAAAASPLIRDRAREGGDPAVWTNRAFTGLFEPGSVFKVFTAALLLRAGAVDTGTVFDCSNEDFGRFRIHNSEEHSYGPLNLMEAFAKSSNIWFARAVGRLSARDVYDGLRDFGFGARIAAPYGALPSGLLAKPEKWNIRTQATLGIGQEIAVTPLQLALAGCAVANGGLLPAPRFVREVRDHAHHVIERAGEPQLRRVLSEPQARLLRLAMARAVGHGTGKAAAVSWTRVGGKTGTAQKADGPRGYMPGAYVASFLGCVPIDEPRLVILALLDEPDRAHHYASQSAAPLFGRIVEGIRRSTDWLTGVAGPDPALTLVARPTPSASVPDVLYLTPAGAAEELRRAGLALGGGGRGGLVVEQVPDAGARCAIGDTVWVTLASGQPRLASDGQLCPDLRGLSNRQVDRLAARLGLAVHVRGAGYVARQEPAAGAALDTVEAVTVVMEPRWN